MVFNICNPKKYPRKVQERGVLINMPVVSFVQLEKQQQQIAKKNFSKVEHLNQV